MSSRIARDSLNPIREIEEASLQRRRSWSRAIGRSTGIPGGSTSDHGCWLDLCEYHWSKSIADRIERRTVKERDGSRPSTINSAATVDISPPRPATSHAIKYFSTRDETLPLLFRDRSSSAATRVALFLFRWKLSRQSRRSLTSSIDHHTAKDMHTANHLSFSHILRYHRRYFLSKFFEMLWNALFPLMINKYHSPRCSLASRCQMFSSLCDYWRSLMLGEASWCTRIVLEIASGKHDRLRVDSSASWFHVIVRRVHRWWKRRLAARE